MTETNIQTINDHVGQKSSNLATWKGLVEKLPELIMPSSDNKAQANFLKVSDISQHLAILKDLADFGGTLGAIGAAGATVGAIEPNGLLKQLRPIYQSLTIFSTFNQHYADLVNPDAEIKSLMEQTKISEPMSTLYQLWFSTLYKLLEYGDRDVRTEAGLIKTIEDYRGHLSKKAILQDMQAIIANILKTTPNQPSLTEKIYLGKYGNIEDMLIWSESVLFRLVMGAIGYGAAAVIEKNGTKIKPISSEADWQAIILEVHDECHRMFGESLEKVGDVLVSAVQHSVEHVGDNFERFIEAEVLVEDNSDFTTPNKIHHYLQRNWPAQGWFVLMYEGKIGWRHHSVENHGGFLHNWTGKIGQKEANLVVWGWDRDPEPEAVHIQEADYEPWTKLFNINQVDNLNALDEDWDEDWDHLSKIYCEKFFDYLDDHEEHSANEGEIAAGWESDAYYLCWVGNQFDGNVDFVGTNSDTQDWSMLHKKFEYDLTNRGGERGVIQYILVKTDTYEGQTHTEEEFHKKMEALSDEESTSFDLGTLTANEGWTASGYLRFTNKQGTLNEEDILGWRLVLTDGSGNLPNVTLNPENSTFEVTDNFGMNTDGKTLTLTPTQNSKLEIKGNDGQNWFNYAAWQSHAQLHIEIHPDHKYSKVLPLAKVPHYEPFPKIE